MANDKYFIEQRADRRYKALKPNADRASAVEDTQRAAIKRAKELNPDATILVERVRDVGPGRDKWRKP
ncbi:DUF2188 domain-containing protein [Sphingomonas sp. C8-2]|nr:DUF2188 domain-containing protein [Sphingomonas sp. C8-2]